MKYFLLLLSLLYPIYGSIKIYSPDSLASYFRRENIRHSYANFGKIPYGTILAGRVFYFEDNPDFCSTKGKVILDREGDPDDDFSPIVLVERGNCSFIRKAKNVQEIGGALALIVDNQDRNPEYFIMVDDGTAYEIVIPTILVSKSDGQKIKQTVLDTESENKGKTKHKEFVVLMVDFEMEKPDDRVEYDIWYTSGDLHALKFLKKMKKYSNKLGANALMTPHMIVRKCHDCTEETTNCMQYDQEYYCAPYSDSVLDPRMVLKRGVEELCIYQLFNETGKTEKWWEYMKEVYECKGKNFEASCIAKAQEEVGVDGYKLNACRYKAIDILRREESAWTSSGIPYSPAVVVNNRVYRVF
eukprot:TRINITY_DN2167_c0_g3_i1.p1 TRINITY_DN2167_c0_g3~~TRINITY_DN2167_c0_g3_i1.p1  ORF type:complete len:357 (-),score=83.68 TRINITY_DN2167_c0_g3_i1:372-1442(-)